MSYHERLSKQLYNIAATYFLLHVDITLGIVNICPDWAGYIFILGSLSTLAEEEPSSLLLRPLCIVLIVWEGIKWLVPILFDATVDIEVFSLVALIVQLYLHFQLLTNLANIAQNHNSIVSYNNLLLYRTVRTIMVTAIYVLMPWTKLSNWLNIIMIVVYVIAGLLICRDLYCLSEEIRREGRKQPYTEQ